ncbi:MAG: Pycsar system effector family protein [Pseudomonadota bacterium]
MAKAEFAANQAQHVITNIAMADTKATWTFAVLAGVIGYVVSQTDVVSAVVSAERPWLAALAGLALAALLLGAGAAFLVILPRTSGAPGGIFFFGAVAVRADAGAYLDELQPLSHGALIEARIRHNFEIARVCRRKYRVLRLAMLSGVIGLGLAVTLVAVTRTFRTAPIAAPERPQPAAR